MGAHTGEKVESYPMSRLSHLVASAVYRCFLFALMSAVSLQAQSTPAPQDSAAMTERVQQLEKQLDELKSEIASIKAASSAAPAPAAAAAAVPQSNLVSPAPSADAAKPSALATILGPTSLSGFVDVY